MNSRLLIEPPNMALIMRAAVTSSSGSECDRQGRARQMLACWMSRSVCSLVGGLKVPGRAGSRSCAGRSAKWRSARLRLSSWVTLPAITSVIRPGGIKALAIGNHLVPRDTFDHLREADHPPSQRGVAIDRPTDQLVDLCLRVVLVHLDFFEHPATL